MDITDGIYYDQGKEGKLKKKTILTRSSDVYQSYPIALAIG